MATTTSSPSSLSEGIYWLPDTPLPSASDAIEIRQAPGEVQFSEETMRGRNGLECLRICLAPGLQRTFGRSCLRQIRLDPGLGTDYTAHHTQNYWDNVVAPSNPRTFDGRVWGVRQWRGIGPNKLQVELQRSWYRYQLYLHFSPRALEMKEKLNPFGCCAITLVDGGTAIMAGRRSSQVACCPNMWHLTPAGTVDVDDPVAVIRKEMPEELGVPGDSLDVRLLGKVTGIKAALDGGPVDYYAVSTWSGLFDTGAEQAHKPELVFVIDLGSTKSSDILARTKTEAVDNAVHDTSVNCRACGTVTHHSNVADRVA
ncbi:hypothetical protein FOL46_001461 [Perkinsus olseni]|uniref:Uncharacterized protein n=1 Tax=Perkinsus olseni TaxID=32597 RepID=A0A7J6KRN0_PEROL|nr:hypothetical protein FOL46_001461 [Perkinsus olseni]